MHKQTLKPQTLRDRWIERFRVGGFACLATLLALPANAGIAIPNDPLTTGNRVPPNIMFILDDSGSMVWDFMPGPFDSREFKDGGSLATTPVNISIAAYTRNTLSYNPNIKYTAWTKADGSLVSGGTSFTSVYDDDSGASGNKNLASVTRTFYAPKFNMTDPADARQYYRYQIVSGNDVIRSEYGAVTTTNNGSNSCTGASSGDDWINCISATPTGRSVAEELTNYATWYSFHRTRIKVAKAGASASFSQMGTNVRAGFRTIWDRSNYDIPVNNNDGLFDDPNGVAGSNNNRTTWFNRLFAAAGNSGTPLHSALDSAGQYFSRSDENGPWGPKKGVAQLACRQNFAILTTDGYWNTNTTGHGEWDDVSGSAITGPNGASYTYSPVLPYKASDSSTLADVAMHYWRSDLRGLSNVVPPTANDPAFWQHMVTFGISIGLKGSLDPKTDLPALISGSKSWPNPNDSEDGDRIDDLFHASVNGHGSFVAASNPQEFADGLKNALSAITERTGSSSNVAANSTRIDTDTKIFQATYVSGVWTGEFSAYSENATTKKFDVLAWKASEQIPTAGRKILTHTGAVAGTFPTADQTTALDRNGTSDQYKVTGADNAAYIAGNGTLELRLGGTLRNRNSVLGDIVSSSPAYAVDTDTLYVGANDGMLHAIDADDGAELFAYVPAGINLGDLATISRPDYAHRYFVDGPMVVSTRAQTPGNKNILVGALGKGGKGVFALDVTSPNGFTATNVKWDKTGSNALPANGYVQDADMGLVQGAPIIAKLNNDVTVAIVSNGINSTNNHAVLFIYNLDSGALISKIDTGAGTAADPNGLSAPVAWDDDGDGRVDHVYAGDLHGNLWKFDLSSSLASDWELPGNLKKLFAAQYPASPVATRQPITSGPTVALDPKTYKTWVFFGTGSFMTTGDVTNQNVQSLYGLIDNDSTTLRTDLTLRQTVLAGTRDGLPVRSFEANTSLPTGSKGWFINLLTPPSGTVEGERIVSDPQMYGSALVVASIIPIADACQSDGKGYVNALDAFTGTSLGTSFFDLPGGSTLTDSNGTELPIGSVDLGVGMGTMPNLMRGRLTQGGSTGGKKDVKIIDPRNTGRVSWREVIRD